MTVDELIEKLKELRGNDGTKEVKTQQEGFYVEIDEVFIETNGEIIIA